MSALFEQYTAMLIDWQGCGFDLVSNDLMWCLYGFIKVVVYKHGLINYIDTKTKWRHLQNLLVKELCGVCLLKFIDWRYSQSCWYFRPVATLTFSLVSSPPPPFPV
jgi:hypothetical protein